MESPHSTRAAEESAVSAEQARGLAREGMQAAGEATEAMHSVRESSQEASTAISKLAKKSQQIGQFITTITGVAEQTNLLALRAAIEAARAGEQGRGFAVVAEELRKLAEESQDAAPTISGLVNEIQTGTRHTVGVVDRSVHRSEISATIVDRAHTVFGQLGEAVKEMAKRIESIAAASQQIGASTERVGVEMTGVAGVAESASASAEEVSASTEQTSASAQEINASAQELASTAQQLEQLVGRFNVNGRRSLRWGFSVLVDLERPAGVADLRPGHADDHGGDFGQLPQFGSNIELIAPASFLSLVVPLIVFFAFQRYFVQRLLAGSVK